MGVGKFGRRWKKVAEFMGSGLTGPMCYERWKSQLDPEVVAKKKPRLWTAEMVCSFVCTINIG
jgi:aspartate aminotransferase-like enzyme